MDFQEYTEFRTLFNNWLRFDRDKFLFSEIGEQTVSKKTPEEIFSDPALETAMYLAYRMAYDPITKRDKKDEKAVSWSHDDWTGANSAPRAVNWNFYGTFPNEADLNTIRAKLEANGGDIQKTVNELMLSGEVPLNGVGGITFRNKGAKGIKLVGSYGGNSMSARLAKMMGLANITHEAEQQGKEILTGVDSELKQMLIDANKLAPKLHKQGKIPSPQIGLSTPPKELMPLLYDIVTTHPLSSGDIKWKGLNPETGGMKANLKGTGDVEKFIFGNNRLWQNQIRNAFAKSGMLNNPMVKPMIMAAANQPGELSPHVVGIVNGVLKKQFPNAPMIGSEGIKWLLQYLG